MSFSVKLVRPGTEAMTSSWTGTVNCFPYSVCVWELLQHDSRTARCGLVAETDICPAGRV